MNPISVLEESFNFLKNYIDNQTVPSGKITPEIINALNAESAKILALCHALNARHEVVTALNSSRKDGAVAPTNLRTEQFFLSDLVNVYQDAEKQDAEIAKFVMAYYYDALRNQHFADSAAAEGYSKLVTTPEFGETVKRIIAQNKIETDTENSVVSSLLKLKNSEANDFEQFQKNFAEFAKLSLPENYWEEARQKAENLSPETEKPNPNISYPPQDDTLEKTLAELDGLIGLNNIKKDVRDLINFLEIQKKRDAGGLKNVEIALHSVFLGPPGTGKTTVARLLGRIFKHLGYLPTGQLYETDREGLIAGYVGQTAIKTDKVIDESVGGVLFIDEAYALTAQTMGTDFGSEAINTIIKRMEDHRDDLAVVVAGYTKPMEQFIESNPGIRSRFSRYFHFQHFTKEELMLIFQHFCRNYDFILSDGATEKLQNIFLEMDALKTESFGNARLVRNIFEKTVQNQANRLVFWSAPSEVFLKTIFPEDIPAQEEITQQMQKQREEPVPEA